MRRPAVRRQRLGGKPWCVPFNLNVIVDLRGRSGIKG
jgi:hypothetical protein